MNSFYNNTLYPLQDKVLQIISSLNTGFYLTGGTVLSRFYYPIRFSDDLDFFIQNETQFINLTEKIINSIKLKHEIEIDTKDDSFVSITVEKILKVDFVNDIGEHFGDFKKTDFFEKIDSPKIFLQTN